MDMPYKKRLENYALGYPVNESWRLEPNPDMMRAMKIVGDDIKKDDAPFDIPRYTAAVSREMYYQAEMKLLLAIAYHAIRQYSHVAVIKLKDIEIFSLSGAEYHELLNGFLSIETNEEDITVRMK